MRDEMQRLGILDNPKDYLIRLVRTNLWEKLITDGCERNSKSYKDPLLEQDFKLAPDEYTYAYSIGKDSVDRFAQNAGTMIERGGESIAVFYKAKEMIPHHEEKYDAALNLGLGATAVTYSFRNPKQKNKAIYAIATYKGLYARDYYDYASKLEKQGRKEEAISAYRKFVDSPPGEWPAEEKQKWIARAKRDIAELQSEQE
jgi:hypothetical protein